MRLRSGYFLEEYFSPNRDVYPLSNATKAPPSPILFIYKDFVVNGVVWGMFEILPQGIYRRKTVEAFK